MGWTRGGRLRGAGGGGMEKACFSGGSDRSGSCNFYQKISYQARRLHIKINVKLSLMFPLF